MKIVNLQASNFFSFQHIDLDLDSQGVLVNGWNEDTNTCNASGKSSLTSKAIPWVLYGRTINGLKGDDVCRKGTTECWGQIEFISRSGQKFRITRKRPTSLILEEYIDGYKDISCKVQSETQEKINHFLGKTFDAFVHTDFFGQGLMNTFMNMSAVQQNVLFGFVISLDKINELVDKTKKVKRGIIDQSIENEKQVSELTGSINQIEKQINSAFIQKNKLEQIRKDLAGDLENLDFDNYTNALEKEIEKSNKDKDDSEEKVNNYKTVLSRLQTKKAELSGQVRIVKENLCPTCNQQIDNLLFQRLVEAQKKILEELGNLETNISSVTSVLPGWQKYYKDSSEKLTQISDKLNKVQSLKNQSDLIDLDQLQTNKKELEDKIKDLEIKRADYNNDIQLCFFWEKAFHIDFRNFLIEKSCPFLEYRANKHLEGLGQSHIKMNFSTSKELKYGGEKIFFNVSANTTNGGNGFDTLSGGEQQFVSFAAGLAFSDLVAHVTNSDSNLMILDEPFVCLDEINSEKLVSYIRDVISKVKPTILLVSNENSIKELVPKRINVVKKNGISYHS